MGEEKEPRRLEPPRPWLSRSSPPDSAAEPEPPAAESESVPDGAPGSRLEPVRPWLKQQRPDGAERPGSAADPATSPPARSGERGRVLDPSRPWVGRPAPAAGPAPSPAPSNAAAVLEPLAAELAHAPEHVADSLVPGLPTLPIADEPDVPASGRLRRATRWLFEQSPERAEQVAEPVVAEPGSARGDLVRRLSAPAPTTPVLEPEPVPLPPGASLRPTIAWDELVPPSAAPDADVPEAAAEPEREPQAVPEAAAEPEREPQAEPEPELAVPERPRRRPRPYAGAPAPSEDASVAGGPHRVTPSIASGSGPAAFTRAHGPTTEDLLTRADGDEPPAGSDRDGSTGPPAKRHNLRWLVRTGVVLAVAVLAATLLRVFVVAPYYIPSASMEPTLHGCSGCNNDHVLVDKLSYRMHDIHRGDLVVFHRPSTWAVPEKVLVKRVIGLPGDTLQVRDGKLLVNGLVLQESYVNPKCPASSNALGSLADGKTYGPVPLGDVFVMGDNRCNSTDSRDNGPVPDSTVIGRAFVIVWPLGRIHFL